jgi:hypothetical protein
MQTYTQKKQINLYNVHLVLLRNKYFFCKFVRSLNMKSLAE